jgi:hypothetical protein
MLKYTGSVFWAASVTLSLHSLVGSIGCTFGLAVSILNMLLIDVMLLQSQVTLVHNTICSLSNLQPCTQYQIYFLTNFFIVTLGNCRFSWRQRSCKQCEFTSWTSCWREQWCGDVIVLPGLCIVFWISMCVDSYVDCVWGLLCGLMCTVTRIMYFGF